MARRTPAPPEDFEEHIVDVDMGDTACKVPNATDYIAKIESMNRVGKKRKTMKC